MIYCGLKLTHDSTVTVFEDSKLLFSIELEKVKNHNRFKILDDNTSIERILFSQGMRLTDIDKFIVDGWYGPGNANIEIRTYNNCEEFTLPVAPYHENNLSDCLLTDFCYDNFKIGNLTFPYTSFMHSAGHVFSSYCTSEFSNRHSDSLILIWDGGMHPRLYYFHGNDNKIQNLGELFFFGANIYSMFLQNYGPFKINENIIKDELSIAGKIMAYVAYGQRNQDIVNVFKHVYNLTSDIARQQCNIPNYPYLFGSKFRQITRDCNFYDEDVITSFHHFIQELLIEEIKCAKRKHNIKCNNLCISGGAALNIKWNSAIRNSGIFENVWVPPFPNDSGSAIGSICCELVKNRKCASIDWNIHSGPSINNNRNEYPDWIKKDSNIDELVYILWAEKEPVILLNGKAELGPRSLGNRSIIAPATSLHMKDLLNRIKYREDFRPIAPLCIESKAHNYFIPGCKDPYMLFDHSIKKNWQSFFPAICHYDGTARLQTVSKEGNVFLFDLLERYEKVSGHPILCNTSANFKGCGFFPDADSAIRWNKLNYVWSDGVLYYRKNKLKLIEHEFLGTVEVEKHSAKKQTNK